MPNISRRIVLFVVVCATLATGFFLARPAPPGGLLWNGAPPEVQAILWPESRQPGPFELTDQYAEPFTPEDLEGQWGFVFFGYLGCPDVCPTSLHAMREFRQILLEQGQSAQFYFVSLDPENDSVDAIASYLDWYQAGFIGLSGSRGEIEALADRINVYHAEYVDERGTRTIDHTSSVMIIDPRGRVVGALPPPLVPVAMASQFDRLRRFLAAEAQG